MIDWTNGIDNLKDKFLALSYSERASIIHNVINVHGLSAPRPKAWKQLDAVGAGKKTGIYRKQLFQCITSKHLISKI